MTTVTSVARLKFDDDQYVESEGFWMKAVKRLRRDRLTMLALVIFATLIVLATAAPLITEYILRIDPNDTDPLRNFLPPGTDGHILGTDDLGRDQLARLLHAGRVSIGIGVFGGLFSLGIGITLGMITGYYGGVFDDFMNWVITTIDSIPSLYLLILFSAIFAPNAQTLVLVIAMISWTGSMRLIRGQMLSLREQEYVLAAEALGARPGRVMFIHIFPNVLSLAIVAMALAIANLILVESALSYLGLGVQPPQPTWGNMLSKSQQFFRLGVHLVIFPGLMIFITVLCSYIVGDGLRDALDPTLTDQS